MTRPTAKVAALPKHPQNPVWHRHSLAMLCATACNVTLLALAGWSLASREMTTTAFNTPAPAGVAAATAQAIAKAAQPSVVVQAASAVETAQLEQVDKALKAAVRHATSKPASRSTVKTVSSAKPVAAKASAVSKMSEKELLARVMWHEARGQGRLGMLAAGIVTMNRVHSGYNGNRTLTAVVNEPFAYTWIKQPQPTSFSAGSPSAKAAMDVATRLLEHRLLPDEQALADKLGAANHFHAVTMPKYPGWTASGRLVRVKLAREEEVSLGAVFYAPREEVADVASR